MVGRSTAMVEAIRRHRFTVEDFRRMGEVGILGEDDRVELLDGEILVMGPIGRAHRICVNRLTALFGRLGDRAIVQVQGPVRIDDGTEPQPDLCLLRYREDFYRAAEETPGDVLLLVEVAETSLAYDRDRKLPRYAAAGIPECWLVDLPAGIVEVHSRPTAEGYGEVRRRGRGALLSPVAIPDFEMGVDELLP